MNPSLDDLRRYALSRSLFKPTTLPRALARLGFVQADPIRAPARAQDLTLRHRVQGYRAGDLERRYSRLPLEEDCFVNYGFMPRATHELMHPRRPRTAWPAARRAQADAVLEFVRERGVVHPREVDAQFQHGKSKNWFGGSTKSSTQLLDGMHYRGFLRVAGRIGGVRTYAARDVLEPVTCVQAALDALVDVMVRKYAPLPGRSLAELIGHLRHCAPQWGQQCAATLARTRARLPHVRVQGLTWYWPEGDKPGSKRHILDDRVRLLAPFDPVVWDRRRFEAFWGWAYRFEAYIPAARRQRGYYAMPLLWRGKVIGWGNLAVQDGRLGADLGFEGPRPRERAFNVALDDELAAVSAFLGLQSRHVRPSATV